MSKRWWVLVVWLWSAAALAGCGSSGGGHTSAPGVSAASGGSNGEASKSPVQILADAASALRSAHGYVMQGWISRSGQVVRLRVVAQSSASLELTISSRSAGAEMIALPTGSFIRGNKAFWDAQLGPRGSLLADRWFHVPPSGVRSVSASLGPFAPATLARCLVEGHGTLSIAGRTAVAGRPAIVIKDAGDVAGDGPGTLAVATTGAPYPLRIMSTGPQRPGGRIDVCNDGKGGDTRGSFTLSQFGAVAPISAPRNALALGQTTAA